MIIKVTERPRLTKFAFKGGVKKSDADDLRGKIRLLKERVVTDYMIGSIKNTVRDYYLEKGYYFNKVDITQKRDTMSKTPHTILTIKVTKGRKVRIGQVNFIGNKVINSGKLRRNLEESKQFRWYNPFNSAKYLEENLKKALPYTEHFHISEPFLELITNNKTNHEEKNRNFNDLTILTLFWLFFFKENEFAAKYYSPSYGNIDFFPATSDTFPNI